MRRLIRRFAILSCVLLGMHAAFMSLAVGREPSASPASMRGSDSAPQPHAITAQPHSSATSDGFQGFKVILESFASLPVLSADNLPGQGWSAWAQTHNAAWMRAAAGGDAGMLLLRVTNCTARQGYCGNASRLAATQCDLKTGACDDLRHPDNHTTTFEPNALLGERSVEDPRVTFEEDGAGGGTWWLVYSVYTTNHDRVRAEEQRARGVALPRPRHSPTYYGLLLLDLSKLLSGTPIITLTRLYP